MNEKEAKEGLAFVLKVKGIQETINTISHEELERMQEYFYQHIPAQTEKNPRH